MKILETLGATSRIWQIFIADSSSTTGAGLTGLVFNTASLTCYYHRDTDTTATAMTLVTMTVGTFTSLGFKEIDATNMPGWYQLCPPNAALASGAKSVVLHLKGATNMAPLPIEVQLTAVDLTDAVRMGLTALPNAAAGANTGLPVVGTQVPNATAGAANGLFIAGTNAATAVTTSFTINGVAMVSQTGDSFARIGVAGVGLTNLGDTRIANLDAAVTTRMAGYTQPTGFLAATFPTGTIANTTNLTAGTIAAVSGNVGGSVASIGANGLDAAALATDAVTEIVTAIFARAFSAAYGSFTFDQIIKIILAVEAGKVSGLDVGAPAFRNIADNGNVVVATTDVDGNRSVVTITP